MRVLEKQVINFHWPQYSQHWCSLKICIITIFIIPATYFDVPPTSASSKGVQLFPSLIIKSLRELEALRNKVTIGLKKKKNWGVLGGGNTIFFMHSSKAKEFKHETLCAFWNGIEWRKRYGTEKEVSN